MKNLKAWSKKLLFLPPWLILLLTLVSVVSLVVVFVNQWDTSPLAIVSYVLSFYALTVLCIGCLPKLPKYVRVVRQEILNNPLGNRFLTDAVFKTHVKLYISLGINLLYVALNLLFGFLYQTAWFVILAGYYTILAVMRFLLVRYVKHNTIGESLIAELKRSRACAFILLTVNLSLSAAVLMMMYQNRGYHYPGVLIYVMAAYTFYITTAAIINLIKYNKYHSPVMSTATVINLAAALVSMLALETAMFTQFGRDNSPEFRRLMIAATGGGVSVILVTLSIFMIVRANKEIRKLKNNKS